MSVLLDCGHVTEEVSEDGCWGTCPVCQRPNIVAEKTSAPPKAEAGVAPISRGFTYEVRLNVSIPRAWAALLKESAKHHYDYKCNEAGHHGVVNGLFNTAVDSEWPSTFPVSWSDLDLVTKVAEQLEYHTPDHAVIRQIRAWLRETMGAIEHQRRACLELPGTMRDE